ncbi:hypothetical protein HMPREF3034_01016 [Prevotella sp. DNF00663]|uniref:hypothetical protein n=1 Tax=unclassified Prevotella TaxID=2638335 RepID=UPI00051405E6|nr:MULTISPECIES: hypothetical protein [unclassified Prevotella]KGI59464.1 hypothetical protein HMPREF0671_11595 [Prevotella sp. S7 MS 2]KXB83864.1 hypothetical protein HMPREF3034_01016 [Prevotella sp. DNF00663]
MKNSLSFVRTRTIYIVLFILYMPVSAWAQRAVSSKEKVAAAAQVIQRFSHDDRVRLKLLERKTGELKTFKQQVNHNKLIIEATSRRLFCSYMVGLDT